MHRSIENYIIPWCMVSPRFDVSCWLSSLGSFCTKTDLPSPFLSSPRLLVEILRVFGNWNTQYLLQLKRIWENKCLQVFAQVCMGGVERGRVLICWKSRNTAPMKYYHSTQIFKYSTPMKWYQSTNIKFAQIQLETFNGGRVFPLKYDIFEYIKWSFSKTIYQLHQLR